MLFVVLIYTELFPLSQRKLWDSNTDVCANTDIITTQARTNTPSSPKHAHEWQDKQAVFWVLLKTMWSPLTAVVNELAKAPSILCQTVESINNTALASVSQPGGPIPPSPFSVFFSFLFIHHHFFKILFSSWMSSVFLITSGLFITNDTLHIALRRYSECRRKWGLPSHCVLIDEKGDRGEESFYLLTKFYAGAWISAFIVRLSSVWRLC